MGHLTFLRRFLPDTHGVPSPDTLGEVIRVLDPGLFKACFTRWVAGLREDEPDLVAIGKAARRPHARRAGRAPLHLVSAWAGRQRLVRGQQATDAASNEITAIPHLLERLALTGALVTIDAIGYQTRIAQAILKAPMTCWPSRRTGRHGTMRSRAAPSCPPPRSTRLFARAGRAHWHIENRLHWVMDAVFRDHLARLRTGHGPHNMAAVRHMVMNLVRPASGRHSFKLRRKKATWNVAYLEALLRQTA